MLSSFSRPRFSRLSEGKIVIHSMKSGIKFSFEPISLSFVALLNYSNLRDTWYIVLIKNPWAIKVVKHEPLCVTSIERKNRHPKPIIKNEYISFLALIQKYWLGKCIHICIEFGNIFGGYSWPVFYCSGKKIQLGFPGTQNTSTWCTILKNERGKYGISLVACQNFRDHFHEDTVKIQKMLAIHTSGKKYFFKN